MVLCMGLLTGNLWVYPKIISQGWNATLGHLPYHSLRLDAIDYLNEKSINIEEVASFFPNYNILDYIDFKEQKSLAKHYSVLKQFHKFNTTIKIYILKKHDTTRR